MQILPSTSVQEIKENIKGDLKVVHNIKPILSPSEKELELLRDHLDPKNMYLKKARSLEGVPLSYETER